MNQTTWETPRIALGERRLRPARGRQSLQLSRSLKVSLALFVLFVVLGAAHSLWTIRTMQNDQQSLDLAARMDHHLQRMTDRADHYTAVAPRNYRDFNRDVDLYYANLLQDIDTMDTLVADLGRRDVAFDPDLWNRFRNGLEQQIGYETDRPRLEWASEYLVAESGPMLAAAERVHRGLELAAVDSRQQLWIASIGLALATLLLAVVTVWLFRERVLKRLSRTSRQVRLMSDGQFEGIDRANADDELGQVESAVKQLARRTRQLVNVLDGLNGANTLQEAIDRIPTRLRRQFGIEWLALVEVNDGRMRLRVCQPDREKFGIEQPAGGWSMGQSLLGRARESGHAMFASLRNEDGELFTSDPLLAQLRSSGLVTAALLPVRDNGRIESGLLIASANPNAFEGWRARWLENVGHLIAHAFYKSIHVEQLTISMIRGLAELAERHDRDTGQHLERMQRYAGIVARELVQNGSVDSSKMPRFAEQVEAYAPLHDIGKVGISDAILRKPGPLTRSEVLQVREHPRIGAEVLAATGKRLGAEGDKLLAHALDIVLYHHEKYDGSGYPHGLVGDAIPLSARVVSLVDAFDALTSERAYKNAWSDEDAINYLEAARGKDFDPQVLDAFHTRIDEILRVRKLFKDVQAAEAV
ncbi:MAG: HD domain-containing protein [Wenzhouxiangellaceae bacterium]|nr:HD domain-containing protein [Wenzhouxiangellaceae bacterium]